MTKVYAFDFDGTLTKADTLLEFIKYACGKKRFYLTFALYSPLIALMLFKLYPNWKVKQKVFAHLFRGMPLKDFDHLCEEFAASHRHLLRQEGMGVIRKAIEEGGKVVIISASIENWVRPFFQEFGDKVKVACTKIDVKNERLTGHFLTKNCYGDEKLKRLTRLFPYRSTYYLTAYGDTEGDKAMLDYADESYYRPFGGDGGSSTLQEAMRFALVGVIATVIQVVVYWIAVHFLHFAIANTLGYAISLAFNYVASTKYTFQVEATMKRGVGFLLSHAINYLLQTSCLFVFIQLIEMDKKWALIPMFSICVPVNFVLVRYFLKKK